MQKLILPFKKNIVSASCQHPYYRQYWGYDHYGWDMGCDESGYNVKACGDGKVIETGYDTKVGNVIVIQYNDVQLKNGKIVDLISRMYHLKSTKVRKGQSVKKGDIIGEYGNTGAGNWGIHLHIEFDTDTKYPCYAPSVSGGNIIKRGNASTIVNPKDIFNIDKEQTIRGCPANDKRNWYTSEDINLPKINESRCPTCGREW